MILFLACRQDGQVKFFGKFFEEFQILEVSILRDLPVVRHFYLVRMTFRLVYVNFKLQLAMRPSPKYSFGQLRDKLGENCYSDLMFERLTAHHREYVRFWQEF